MKEDAYQNGSIIFNFTREELKKAKVSEIENIKNAIGMGLSGFSSKHVFPNFRIELEDCSHITTLITFNPNRDIVEDRPKKKEYSRQDYTIILSRLMLTIYKLNALSQLEHLIFFFKYPRLSLFLLFTMITGMYLFDP